jgi:hypothetical protein
MQDDSQLNVQDAKELFQFQHYKTLIKEEFEKLTLLTGTAVNQQQFNALAEEVRSNFVAHNIPAEFHARFNPATGNINNYVLWFPDYVERMEKLGIILEKA